jgi:hypothetical protein
MITASYEGDSAHQGSGTGGEVRIDKRTSSTSVDCTPSTTKVGIETTCTATVADTAAGGPLDRSGTITWSSTGSGEFTPANSCTLSSNTCSVTYTPTATGTETIGAHYDGDSTFDQSSAPGVSLTVGKRDSATSVECTPAGVSTGQATACTAMVTDTDSGMSTMPGGIVDFSSSGSGSFDSTACTLASGGCSVTFTPSAPGAQTLTASYAGDALHGPSTGQKGVNASAAPAPQAAPNCDPLHAKLKRQKHKRSRAKTHRKRALIARNIRDTRARLARRGC